MHFAARAAAALVLLQAKADPNARNGEEHTVLIEAVMQGQLGAAKLLLQWGADPALTLDDEDDGPQTALDLAKEAEADAELIALLTTASTAEGLAKIKAEGGAAATAPPPAPPSPPPPDDKKPEPDDKKPAAAAEPKKPETAEAKKPDADAAAAAEKKEAASAEAKPADAASEAKTVAPVAS